jgi:YD repeat-containing protein
MWAHDLEERVTSKTYPNGTSDISYDALGRVTGTTNALGSFTNNYVGVTPLLASVVYPNGQSNSFSYLAVTNDERLAEIYNQHAGTNISKFDYSYDADGQIQTWTQQADAATPNVYQYQYDRAGQLISSVLKTTGASPTVLKQFAYL